MIEIHLCCIFLILVIILIFKLFLDDSKMNTDTTITNHTGNNKCNNPDCKCNEDINILLEKLKISTNEKINSAVEQGIREGFSAMNGIEDTNTDSNIISYINKDKQIKLMLFYNPECPYCKEFMPIWSQIINELPNTILYEEINTSKDIEKKKSIEYKIISVPTIILVINNNKIKYEGNRSYKDIERFLKENDINLIIKTFEDFDDSGYNTFPSPTEQKNNNCPDVTFDSNLDVATDNYMFQIFNSKGQYGYATGGSKPDKLMSPFTAAYSVVDSYLSSLPDKNKMNECANFYSNNIINFGLCNNEELDNILNYDNSVQNGTAKMRLDGTDYSTNNNVVNAIKKACNI